MSLQTTVNMTTKGYLGALYSELKKNYSNPNYKVHIKPRRRHKNDCKCSICRKCRTCGLEQIHVPNYKTDLMKDYWDWHEENVKNVIKNQCKCKKHITYGFPHNLNPKDRRDLMNKRRR